MFKLNPLRPPYLKPYPLLTSSILHPSSSLYRSLPFKPTLFLFILLKQLYLYPTLHCISSPYSNSYIFTLLYTVSLHPNRTVLTLLYTLSLHPNRTVLTLLYTLSLHPTRTVFTLLYTVSLHPT